MTFHLPIATSPIRAIALAVFVTVGSACSAFASDAAAEAAVPAKVLHLAARAAETGFDPARIDDNTSLNLVLQVFEGLYTYDYLARPLRIRPALADGMPIVSADGLTWTIRIKPGIHFDNDPAFGGKLRELVAQDFVYSLARLADPAVRSPWWSLCERVGIRGLAAARRRAIETRQPFDHDRPIEGLRAIGRYTLQIRLDAPRPRLTQWLVDCTSMPVAREVADAYGGDLMTHPVGVGPYRVAQWRRSSLIVLERNPNYRDVRYDAEPAADDAQGTAWLARFKGRRLPMIDRVEVSIVEEGQPIWLAFLNGSLDLVEVPPDFQQQALPGGRLAPYLARRGIVGDLVPTQAVYYVYFNMEDPLVGGYAADKVALRRAIGLALDVQRMIGLARGGVGRVAQGPIGDLMSGFDPAFRSENGEYSPSRAKALLDTYGYVDRQGTGWRSRPDGTPLVLQMSTATTGLARRLSELVQRDLNAVGLRVAFKPIEFTELLNAGRAGNFMMSSLSYGPLQPDGLQALEEFYGPAIGSSNFSRFDLPAMNALLDHIDALPDGPERMALFDEAKRLQVAYMAHKTLWHVLQSYLHHPRVAGFRMRPFIESRFAMLDLER